MVAGDSRSKVVALMLFNCLLFLPFVFSLVLASFCKGLVYNSC